MSPSLYWCVGLFLPRCRTLLLPLLNSIRFLSAQLSSLSRSRWMAAQPAAVSTAAGSAMLGDMGWGIPYALLSASAAETCLCEGITENTAPFLVAWGRANSIPEHLPAVSPEIRPVGQPGRSSGNAGAQRGSNRVSEPAAARSQLPCKH